MRKRLSWPSCNRVIVFVVLVVIVTRLILWITFPEPPPLPPLAPFLRYYVSPSEPVWSRELISLKANWTLDNSYLQHYNATDLFRWMRKTELWNFYLQSTKKEAKGLVMPVGSKYVNTSITAIYGIRTLGSSLPIEIWHFRGELSIDDLKLFAQVSFLILVDMTWSHNVDTESESEMHQRCFRCVALEAPRIRDKAFFDSSE